MKKAFITGIAGQDGSYLAEYLLELGYEVHGIVRRNSVPEHQQSRIDFVRENLHVYYGDLLDVSGLERLLKQINPDEIYNLGAQSHVRISYDIPQFTVQSNALGVLNILEAYRNACPTAKFYQASSSEMFGSAVDDDGFQRESTPFKPVSPYGCSKVFGFNIVHNYRKAYKLHACNGILFNHESPRRGSNFVTNKVVKGAVMIKKGLIKELRNGKYGLLQRLGTF
jgi:GDPmannose 4,6-dehydratase